MRVPLLLNNDALTDCRVYVGLEDKYGRKIVQVLPDVFEVLHSAESAGLELKPLPNPKRPIKDQRCPLGDSTVENAEVCGKEVEPPGPSFPPRAPQQQRTTWHSFCSVLDGCFEPIFSRILVTDAEGHIPLRTFRDSQPHRTMLYLLRPEARLQLRSEVQEENHRLKERVCQNPQALARLRREFDLANHLVHIRAPIHELPVELLSEIFFIVLDQREHSIDPMTRVCRHWKEVVSSIWGSLRLRTWTSAENVRNVNKGAWLLDVTIDPANDETAQPPAPHSYAALRLANDTTSHRWRELKVLSLPSESRGHDFSLGWPQRQPGDDALKSQLQSLNIEVEHESSPFLDELLSSISAISHSRLIDIQLRSPCVVSYLAQPAGWSISNGLVSFKAVLPRTNISFDILPHFRRLETFEATRLRLRNPPSGVELPLTSTLRQMELKSVPIDWMNDREFPRLQNCTIVSPPEPGVIPVVSLPQCTVLRFEGTSFDAAKAFCTSGSCTLILRSTQWSRSRGAVQLHRLWGMTPRNVVLRPVALHLRIACDGKPLLHAFRFLPELRELVLELNRPTTPGRDFFIGLLPQSTRSQWGCDGAGKEGKQLDVCPSLEVLGLKYRRWLRSSETNEMLLLVAIVSVKRETSRGIRVWVEKEVPCQERVEVVGGGVSAFTLRSLGCLHLPDHMQVPNEPVEDITRGSLATLDPSSVTFRHSETITYLSQTVYPSLFRRLRTFTLTAPVDQGVPIELLRHFEHLEQLSVPKLVPESPQPGLPLFQTLKRMHLGETSLHWMTGCTFFQLEHCRIDKIDDAGFSTPRSIRMPVCASVSISPNPIRVLDAFDFSQLHHLHLSMPRDGTNPPSRRWGEGLYASMRQLNLRSAWFEGFDSPLMLRSALAVQTELEVLEIIHNKPITEANLADLFDVLTEPNTMDTTSSFDNTRAGPRSRRRNRDTNRRAPLCPNLKAMRIKLGETAPSERPGIVHIAHRFMTPRKKKRRHLECCQFWWEKEGWDATPSVELIGSAQPDVAAAKARSCYRDHLPETVQAVRSV